MRDTYNNLKVQPVINPKSENGTTALEGAVIDRAGYESVLFVIQSGVLGNDATFTTLLEESDNSDMSGGNAVSDDDLLGTEALASFAGTDDNKAKKLGYIGAKRYLKLTVTPATNDSASFLSACAILGHPQLAKVGQFD